MSGPPVDIGPERTRGERLRDDAENAGPIFGRLYMQRTVPLEPTRWALDRIAARLMRGLIGGRR